MSEHRGKGQKYDAGKRPLDLIPARSLLAIYQHVRPGEVATERDLYDETLHYLCAWRAHGRVEDLAAAAYQVLQALGGGEYLVSPLALEEVAGVLDFGAVKYGPESWQHVPDAVNRYYAALLRHWCAWGRGEALDPESGLLHTAHAACNVLFLLWFATRIPALPPPPDMSDLESTIVRKATSC